MKAALLCVWLCGAAGAGAIEVTLAPLYLIDETADRVDPRNSWHRRVLDALTATATGRELRFRSGDSALYNPPQSVGDAITVCRTERAEYLIYGFITRKDYTIQGELRLLDYARREVVAVFYAMDSRDREAELVRDLADKIFRYVQEQYHIISVPEPPAFTHIQVPVNLGYWFPAGRSWTPLLTGILTTGGGVQLIPSDRVFVWQGYAHYFSVGIEVSYRFGKGQTYESWNHSCTVSAPLQLHRVMNARHEAVIGWGLSYSLDMLTLAQPYEEPGVELYGAAGVLFSGGWLFRVTERLSVGGEVRGELRFYRRPLLSITSMVGICVRPYTREVASTW